MRRLCLAALLVALSSCSDDQPQREFGICMKQADRIAKTQGSNAGIRHIKQCQRNLASGAY